MPDEPFRLRVLKALTDHLKTVEGLENTVDDYGRPQPHVYRGRDIFGENDPLPIVSILEDPNDAPVMDASGPRTAVVARWRLIVQGFVQDDIENPTDSAYMMSAKVVRAIAQLKAQRRNILGFGDRQPCITDIEVGFPVVRPADGEVSSVSFFYMNVTLHLVEDLENPFQ